MSKRAAMMVLLFGTLLSAAPCSMLAQNGSSPGVLLRLRGTLNGYDGERGRGDAEARHGAPGGIGFEISRRYTAPVEAGLSYAAGHFPKLFDAAPDGSGAETIDPNRSSAWIHMAGIALRYFPPLPVHLYLQAGASATYGHFNRRISAGFGPRVGIGIVQRLTRRTALFAEADALFVIPGNSMDLAGARGEPDMFSSVGLGIQVRLSGRRQAAPPLSAQIRSVYGPASLQPGEAGLFAADVDPQSSHSEGRWDFGDGTSAGRLVAEHTYTASGTYDVTFTLQDGHGTQTRQIETVVTAAGHSPSIGEIYAFPDRPQRGEATRFTADLNGLVPERCTWDMGDGALSTHCEPTHAFRDAGSYTVRLKVESRAGTAVSSRSITVAESPCAAPAALHPVYFEPNSIRLDVNARDYLYENAAKLLQCTGRRITIFGYASPGEDDPDELSQARANAVQQYYLSLGVPSPWLRASGRGLVENVPEHMAHWQYRFAESVPEQ